MHVLSIPFLFIATNNIPVLNCLYEGSFSSGEGVTSDFQLGV